MKSLERLQNDLSGKRISSRELTEAALARIEDPSGEGKRAFIRVFKDQALASAAASDRLREQGIVASPLAGIPFSIKDLCDVTGFTTLAGSVVRAEEPVATQDATVVTRLRAAGAVIVGTTNMTEFAMGTPGTNSHYGTPKNPWDRETGRIPGGSSAGCAVSISDGMAAAGLGTDTAGSVRVPAALCGLTGFKPTARRVPRAGIFPLAESLDSVGPLAPTVACCALLDSIFAGEAPAQLDPFPLKNLRLGALTTLVIDDLDDTVAAVYEKTLSQLREAGALIDDVTIPALEALPQINRFGGFSGAEAYALHRETLSKAGDRYDPNVASRIRRGEKISAADYVDLQNTRARWIAAAGIITRHFDALLMPTCPIVAPPIAELETPEGWGAVGRKLLLPNLIANFLDRCALTLPCAPAGAAPVGLTLMGEAMADRKILEIGCSIEMEFIHLHRE